MKHIVLAASAALLLGGCVAGLDYAPGYGYGNGYNIHSYANGATLDPRYGYDGCPRGYYRSVVQCIRIGGSRDINGGYHYSRTGYRNQRYGAGCPIGYYRTAVQCVRERGQDYQRPQYRSNSGYRSGYQVTPPRYPGGRTYDQNGRGSHGDRDIRYDRGQRDIDRPDRSTVDRPGHVNTVRRQMRNDGSEGRDVLRRRSRNDAGVPPSQRRPERRRMQRNDQDGPPSQRRRDRPRRERND